MLKTRFRKNFTLVELIAVVAIAGILLVLLVPALNSMSAGNKVDMCASRLKLGMEQAASKAATTRKYVALVLPQKAPKETDSNIRFYYGGYRLAYKKNTTTWEWLPDSSLQNPRDGAALVKIDTAKGTVPLDSNTAIDVTKSSLFSGTGTSVQDISVGSDTWPGVIFTPYGGVFAGSNVSADYLYFRITEVKDNGTELMIPNKENTVVLKLSPITGRAEYVSYD